MPIENALSWKGYENLLAIQERLYLPLDPVGVRFFTDASIFLKKTQNIPVVLMGPGNPKMAHQPNETLSLKAFYSAIDFYEAIYQEVF
jgi:succinyl-diaminopimelate desuccinylase